nr:HAMP domain-containing sensor histidine kinase [uncultured Caproiciproducens sp.]
MKKSKFTVTLSFVLLLILLLVCFWSAYYIITPFFSFEGIHIKVSEYLIISMVGVLFYTLLLLLMQICHHKNKKDQSHRNFYSEIQDALDKITKGDFGVIIDMTQCNNHHHLIDLAEKVNVMAQELGGMETMRQDFVSNVSHEIRSPLTSIRGFATLLKNENLSKDERLHYIDIIETESLRLSKLSDNLLKLSNLDSEFISFQPKPYLLNKQLKDVILMLEPQWSAKSIDLVVEDEPADVVADEELLSQVWINLLHNSIKFTQEGGRICVSVSNVEKGVKVMIADNGIGMTADTLTHIFERFYMADKSRSRKAGGSGLGLSIVKRIIEMHQGSIYAESQPGMGTTFSVNIPYKNIK